MATGIQVVFDCADPDSLARFWAEALGYKLQDPPTGYGSWEHWAREQGISQERWDDASAVDPGNRGPRLYFQRVPEAKATKNRVHLDLNASGAHGTPLAERRRRIDAEVERLLGAGATRLGPHRGHIEATNDRIAADNTGQHRPTICQGHRAHSPTPRRS